MTMNTLTTTLLTTVLLGSAFTVSTAQAASFSAADNSPGTKLCMAVTANKSLKLHLAMKDARINKHTLSNKLRCNGMSVAQFAGTYGFDKSAGYLNIDVSTNTSIQDIAMRNNDEVLVVAGSK